MSENSHRFSSRSTDAYSAGNKSAFNKSPLRHRGKFFWFFSGVAILVLVLGSQYIYQNIQGSVGYDLPGFVKEQLSGQSEEDKIADLKQTDTDQDGLTDYQELYQHHTSAFLPDTDSDGYSDFEEATKGEDPLCPLGENCNLLQLITPQTKIAEVIQGVTLDPNLTFADAMAAEFKKFLLANGIPEAELAKMTTEDLLAMMEALESSGAFAEADLSSSAGPTEVREFLLSQPNANAEEINNLSDEDLIKIRDKILEG